jgi:pyruvate/2-oxoacid:ferredoxin oxidoreductase alpha subunit
MKKVMMGNHAVSWGAQLSRVEVVSAYPITPQTQIVEEISEMCADGRLHAKFIKVESEHSAMACLLGASAAGVRTFTATSAQGLALMHELLHYAAGARLPVVMADVNRAMAPGWSIWTDQCDSLAQRDTGWMQFYAESNQEVLDTIIQMFKTAEHPDVRMPAMVILDAFVLSHTSEAVDIPDQKEVDKFLPKYKAVYKLDISDPRAFNALVTPDHYMEMRYDMNEAMKRAKAVFREADEEWGRRFGRRYGIYEKVRVDDADLVIVTSATACSIARIIVEEMRKEGIKVGLLKLKMFRPFPGDEIMEILGGKKKVMILDRSISFGAGGIWSQEIRNVLYKLPKARQPKIFSYVYGLGGRDLTPDFLRGLVEKTMKKGRPSVEDEWMGLKTWNM